MLWSIVSGNARAGCNSWLVQQSQFFRLLTHTGLCRGCTGWLQGAETLSRADRILGTLESSMDVGLMLPSLLCLALPLLFWPLGRRRLACCSVPPFVEGPTEHKLAFGLFALEPSHVYWYVTKDP